MTNQPWQEEIYIKSQNEDYANELIKMVSELSKEQYTAGYKAGREESEEKLEQARAYITGLEEELERSPKIEK